MSNINKNQNNTFLLLGIAFIGSLIVGIVYIIVVQISLPPTDLAYNQTLIQTFSDPLKPNIQIRKARPEDNEEVTDFAFEIMRSMGIEPDPENIDYALATFGQERGIPLSEFVAVDGEQLIGSIILKPISPSVAEMTGFYVKSNYQGQGIGHKLISARPKTVIFPNLYVRLKL